MRLCVVMLLSFTALPALAQLPPGVPETMANLATEPATHIAFTLDRSTLQQAQSLFGPGSSSSLDTVTVDNYHFSEPAFYLPDAFNTLVQEFQAAGWKHLVNAHAGPAANAQPTALLTDLWLRFAGTEIDGVTVLLRGPRQMNVITVSGAIRPLDLLHLSGHFGIPRVDPNAVMVPAPTAPPPPQQQPTDPPPPTP